MKMNWINIPVNLDIEITEDNICDDDNIEQRKIRLE